METVSQSIFAFQWPPPGEQALPTRRQHSGWSSLAGLGCICWKSFADDMSWACLPNENRRWDSWQTGRVSAERPTVNKMQENGT